MEKNPAPLGMPQKILIVGKNNIWGILSGAGFFSINSIKWFSWILSSFLVWEWKVQATFHPANRTARFTGELVTKVQGFTRVVPPPSNSGNEGL